MRKFFTAMFLLLGASSRAQTVSQVIVAEYKTWYVRSDGAIYSYNSMSQYPVAYPIGGRKCVMGAGAFNYFRVLDDQGYIWTSRADLSAASDRIPTDTTGAAFTGNKFVDAYAHVALTIRSNGSVWYFGKDEYSLFYPGGSLQNFSGTSMRPTQLSPAGMTFKKVLLGGNKIIGLTTAGDVYVWYDKGSRTPTKMTIPRPAINIFISHLDVAGCIVPDAGGSTTVGYPYIWGTTSSMFGSTGAYNQPTAIRALWKMTVPIKEICASWNTIHYIDSLGRLFGTGFNSQGEVGNGQEFVNKYNYSNFPGYGWTFTDYENPTGVPVQIATGVTFSHLYSNNWFAFYKYAQDINGNLYSWGRNKALVLGNGFYNMQEQYHPDAMDVLKPTLVTPLTTKYQQYNFTAPVISAGPNQVISSATATLRGTATAVQLVKNQTVAANGINRVGYDIVSYKWTKVSGPNATITTPNGATTTVTGLTAGVYIFNLLTTDNNTGTQNANVTVTVTGTQAPTGSSKVIPGSFEAESYDAMYSVQTQACTDANGGLNVDYITLGSWMKYNVTVQTAGTYNVSIRVATADANTGFVLKSATGSTLATIKLIKSTGGYQAWQTVTTSIQLPAGAQTLQYLSTSGGYLNVNWMSFAFVKASAQADVAASSQSAATFETHAATAPVLTIYPNPVRDNFTLDVSNAYMGTMNVQVIDPSGATRANRVFDKSLQDLRVTVAVGNLAAGIYFVRVQIGAWSETKKMLKL